MTTRLTFAGFDAKLKQGTLTEAEYQRYLEVDPTVNVVRLRFKSGALADVPPPTYDLDNEVYLAQRAAEGRVRSLAKAAKPKLKRVTAEGDSWFNLPPIVRPKAIADRLKSNRRVDVQNVAKWGHTLAEMLAANEYMGAIDKFRPDWFIFSGGGNDLQEALAARRLLISYDANVPIDDCLSASGKQLLETIADGYRKLLNRVAIQFPTLPTICFAYDYPRPTFKEGRYIGQYLQMQGYPRATWDAVAKVMIDRLTETLQPVVEAFPNAVFLDCRGVTAGFPFFDDMHPHSDGFGKLAEVFEKALGVAAKQAAAKIAAADVQTKRLRSTGSAEVKAHTRRASPKRGSKKVKSRAKPRPKGARRPRVA